MARNYRTQNQNPDYVKAHIITDAEAAQRDRETVNWEATTAVIGGIFALIGLVFLGM